MYAQTALDIHQNGISIPSVKGLYDYPNGFLYNYFLALCFTLFGESTIPVYILQSCLLGLSIFVSYRTFRDQMKPITGFLFLIFFFIFGLLDMNKYYSFRFLSENLVILLLALFFNQIKKAFETGFSIHFILSGVLFGSSLLTRPNLLPIAIVIAIALLIFTLQKKISKRNVLFFLLGLVTGTSLLAIRNQYVSGNFTFLPVNSFNFFEIYFYHPDLLIENILHKAMFTMGYLSSINPVFHWRPHWTILWILYFVYLIGKFRKKEQVKAEELIMHLFIFSYAGLMIFVIDTNLIGCYGFRYIIPLIFTTLPFAVLSAEWIPALKRSQETVQNN